MEGVDIKRTSEGVFSLSQGRASPSFNVYTSMAYIRPALSPSDLLSGALGSCFFSIVEVLLVRWAYDPSAFFIRVRKKTEESSGRLLGFDILLSSLFQLDSLERRKIERAMALCPVKKSLSSDLKVDFIWLDRK